MSLTVQLPAEIEAFVRREIADGAASDEAAFVTKAVKVYRELKQRHAALRSDVQRSLQQARNGEISPLDIDGIIAELRQESSENGTND